MFDKIMKFKLTLLLTIFFCSCGLLKESNNEIIYKSINHDQYKAVTSPDYNNLSSWLVHPDHIEKNDFLVDEWTPFYIEGLDKGEVSITLELLDNNGELIETPFNPSSRTVVLE